MYPMAVLKQFRTQIGQTGMPASRLVAALLVTFELSCIIGLGAFSSDDVGTNIATATPSTGSKDDIRRSKLAPCKDSAGLVCWSTLSTSPDWSVM
eukprot:CAMPEP_0116549830 /NCGR_PEP_ID=MMETSP0397-20121206/5095_1 /TAXON_ID=216820 /ORGANISM="Cyclophora tenuis, Strain ECT3854" /LENGTH=94 /DNA_ID=CAMNT_0004074605 /DNA_START=242 /DNA_END=526 /DNA_ORIENTATION=-